MNIESEHINAASRTKNYHSTLIFLWFRQNLDKIVGKSCPELSVKFCPLVPSMVAPQIDPRFGITLRITKLEL